MAIAATALAPLFCGEGQPGSDDEALLEHLRSLGYVAQVRSDPDPKLTGVTLHDATRAYQGIDVYCSVRSKQVRFIDMNGTVARTITFLEAGDGRDCTLVLTGDGDFLALAAPLLMRIGWNSEVRWISREGHHYDVTLDGTGKIFTLSEKRGLRSSRRRQIPRRRGRLHRPVCRYRPPFLERDAAVGELRVGLEEVVGQEHRVTAVLQVV